ncbi:MAG: biotin--[acetyl-CoA-carboxylase] ligase [Flavobacteriales bacterium]
METLFVGQNKITLQTTDSTNNYAAKLLKMSFVPDGTVIMAHNQSEGRGQREKIWESAPGENLLCSYVLKPESLSASEAFLMSMTASLAAYETMASLSAPSNTHIKWPNDIMLNDKKIGGILIENFIVKGVVKYAIVGIGINVNQPTLTYSHATSLISETQRITDLDTLLALLSSYLEKWYLKLQSRTQMAKISQSYNSHLWRQNEELSVKYNDQETKGSIKGVSTQGKLHFLTASGMIQADLSQLKIPYE